MTDSNNPIKYSDLVKPDNSITDLINQLDHLSDAYMNALKNIKSEALTVKASLEAVSGATQEGRKSIKSATSDTERLTRAVKEMDFANSRYGKQLVKLKEAQREANQMNKLTHRLNISLEGSYNKLSAQYSINKIYLNNMTVEEREATEEGRKLVEETKAIYEEMKRLQEATGKTSLNVGNYSEAAKGLTSQIENQTKQLAILRLEGKQNTAEYQQLSKETAILRDAFRDATKEIKNMASDTSNLDAVLGLAAGASGGIAAFTGAMELFGVESEDVQEAQRKLQAAIAITTGVQAIQNAVQKQSALMLGISRIQMAALSKAQVYNRLVTIQGTKATIAATVAQKAFNLIASANPYVILALAIISVVGALALFASNTDKSAKEQQKLNEAQKVWLDYLQAEASELTRVSEERIAQLERELNIARARNASVSEIRKIEDNLYNERKKAHNILTGYYEDEIEQLDQNRLKIKQLRDVLVNLQNSKASGGKKMYIDVDLDGKLENVKIDEAITAIEGQIENYGRKVQIAVDLDTTGANLEAERKILEAQRLRENREMAKAETDIIRNTEDIRIALIKNTYDQERAQRKAANERAIADIKMQLRTEANLTAKARSALNSQIVLLRKKLANEITEINNEQWIAELNARRVTEDINIGLMEEGAERQKKLLQIEYDRQIGDLTIRLATEKNLTEEQLDELLKQQILLREEYAKRLAKLNDEIALDQLARESNRIQLQLDTVRDDSKKELDLRLELLRKQRAIELAENKLLAEDLRQNEADINAKYDQFILDEIKKSKKDQLAADEEINTLEIEALEKSEKAKTKLILEEQKKRLEAELVLETKADGTLTERGKLIAAQLGKLKKEIKDENKPTDIYELLGLNLTDDQKEAINTSVSFAIDQLQKILDAKLAAADAAVEAANKEVDASQRRLDSELEARNNGYANNVVQAQKDLELAKNTQEKALKEQAKAQKAQQAIQEAQQITNLVTASALIWSQLGIWGAIPAIAVMWGSFAAAKIKAAQLAKAPSGETETYGDGTVELLSGGSHQSGNDIDLGTKSNGTRRRAEGGEFFAVINKRNSRRFRGLIPDVIKSLNNGTFMHKYMNAYDGANGLSLTMQSNNPDISDLKNDVREIKEQNKRRSYIDGNGNTIEVYKNLKRKIKNN